MPARLPGMLILVYSAVLTLVIAVMALRSAVSLARHPQYREGLNERFGHMRPELAAAVAGKRVIWLHAVSVGEVLAASRLVKELRAALGEGWEIVVSTTTHTGQALARERFGPERVFYMPIDFGFSMRAYLKALKPMAVVLIESEVWLRMMHECNKRGIPVVVVNARVSDRSFKRSLKVRWLWSRVLRRATLWMAQSEEDARRLVAMGAPPEAVKVGGNLKYDVRAPKESRIAELIREAAAGRPIVVAGSTVGRLNDRSLSEDEIVIQAWEGRVKRELNAMLVLAPRHPERFGEVEATMMEFPYAIASDWADAPNGTPPFAKNAKDGAPSPDAETKSGVDIVQLDTIGDLAAVYGVADVAFVGGSLIKRGGHNPLEPAQFGVPVIMGSSFENFRDVVTKMQADDAISIVTDKDALAAKLVRLLTDREAAKAMGERGRKVFEEQQGATKRAVEAIVAMVKP